MLEGGSFALSWLIWRPLRRGWHLLHEKKKFFVFQIPSLSVTVYRAEYIMISASHASFDVTQPSQSTQIRGHIHARSENSNLETGSTYVSDQNSAPLSAQRTALVDKFL